MSVYLDHSASTPVDERVLEAMLPYFSQIYGNPSSSHGFARQAEKGVEKARETLAQILNCQAKEIVFTSCGSESDNLALRGVMLAAKKEGKNRPHLVSSCIEHSAISSTATQLGEIMDCQIGLITPAPDGMISPALLGEHLREETALVSLMYANNEIGTVLPISHLAEVAHSGGAFFHTDAVQATGQLPVNVQDLNVDLLSISGHKLYGPKGVGALYVKTGVPLLPSQTGGSHEEGRRSGTLNVPLIVGLGKAMELAYAERDHWVEHFAHLRDRLIEGILSRVPDSQLTGSLENRLPSHASFVFRDVDGNQLLMFLDNKGIGASSGSACKTGNPKPSSLLMALGYDENWALGGLRLSVGRHTSDADIDFVLETLPAEVEKVRLFSRMMAN